MTIEFPYLLPKRDAAADKVIHNEILVDAQEDSEILTAWYDYLQETLPFPFSGMVLTEQKANISSYSNVNLLKLASVERCGHRQIWVMGRLSISDKPLLHFFLSDLKSVNKLEAYQPVYNWKYWLNNK